MIIKYLKGYLCYAMKCITGDLVETYDFDRNIYSQEVKGGYAEVDMSGYTPKITHVSVPNGFSIAEFSAHELLQATYDSYYATDKGYWASIQDYLHSVMTDEDIKMHAFEEGAEILGIKDDTPSDFQINSGSSFGINTSNYKLLN